MTGSPRKYTLIQSDPNPCHLFGDERKKTITAVRGIKDIGGFKTAFDDMIDQGFARTQIALIFKQACNDCEACIPVRVDVSQFKLEQSTGLTSTFRRNNNSVKKISTDTPYLEEHIRLRLEYMKYRHPEVIEDESEYTQDVLELMVEQAAALNDANIGLRLDEYRIRDEAAGYDRLVAACWWYQSDKGRYIDQYYYAPDQKKRSLGNYMLIDSILAAKEAGDPHVYLGAWTKEQTKYSYKGRFAQEALIEGNWIARPEADQS